MESTEHAPSGGLMRLAGGLLIAEAVVIFIYPQVWLLSLPSDLHYMTLWASVPVALGVSVPPLVVGIGLLRQHSEFRTVGILVTFIGAVAFGSFLYVMIGQMNALQFLDTGWPHLVLGTVLLVMNLIGLGILVSLAAAGFLGRRSSRPGTQHPTG